MTEYIAVKQPFQPVYDENSRILILGSFPSVKSRETGFYYGHSRNRFWQVLAAVLSVDEPKTVADKKEMLLKNHIAVYDVIESCEIKGSSDSSIRNAVPAALSDIVRGSNVEAVFTNGKLAGKLYQKYQAEDIGLPWIELPSTSPANAAFQTERLTAIWKEKLKEWIAV